MGLVAHVAAHRARLLAAYAGPQWATVAAAYGARQGTRHDQLEFALNAVVSWSRQLTDDPRILAHLDALTAGALDEVAPARARTGLAAIFANAQANTGFWAEQMSSETSYVAACQSCGAPQMRVLHFACEHCERPLYVGLDGIAESP